MEFYKKTINDTLDELNTNASEGLTFKKAEELLIKNGENKLEEGKAKSVFALLFEQINNVMIYVLIIAAILTVIVNKEFTDAIIIMLVVILNAIVGVLQEIKAEKALKALKDMTTPRAIVIRESKPVEIDSSKLVIGDIVVLDAGRYVPADLRLIESNNLQIEESSFTGESVPSSKDANAVFEDDKLVSDMTNMAFMSTLVTYGRGLGVVVAVANDTKIGEIAKLLQVEEEQTPLQKKMNKLGKSLGYIAILICILIFAIGVLQKRNPLDMLVTSISLAVAAIPEGLVAIISIVLALGVTRMSKRNAIVKKMPAVETLGSVNYICSDKTGTLTQNKMTIVETFNYEDNETTLINSFILSSDAEIIDGKEIGDPTEVAFIAYGIKNGIQKNELNEKYTRVDEFAFDSDRKLMSTLNKYEDHYRVHTKGAIDNILKISNRILINGKVEQLTEEYKKEIMEKSLEMSDKALRVMGVAYKDVESKIEVPEFEKDLIVIGIAGMIDPPRLEVKESIVSAKKAGINIIMITGDHKNTAFAIAKQLEIADDISQCMSGDEIEKISDEKLAEIVMNYRVFSRVSPEHKVKIVKALKASDNIVSMTGDGVNDAPSLKIADIGVAMGITGTDVAKGASDMILTDDNFTTIIKAIEEGRIIYNNIKKTIIFLLSCNLGEVISIFIATLLGWPIPLVATQILWVNLVTDTFPALSLGVDPSTINVMNEKPRKSNENFFSNGAWIKALVGGISIGILTLLAFYIGLAEQGYTLYTAKNATAEHLKYARTMSFIVLTISQLFYAYTVRSNKFSLIKIGIFKNKFLNYSLILGIALQMIIIQVPVLADAFSVTKISILNLEFVYLFTIIPLILNEILKKIFRFEE